MNLCIVASGNFFSNYGGGQVYVINLLSEFIRKKDEWNLQLSVISCDRRHPMRARVKEYQEITVYEIHPDGEIKALLQKLHPDVVHANGEKARFAHLCKELSIPCVITAHHGGICCPAGTLLNTKDEICKVQACYQNCLPCYLRNHKTGSFWYHLVRHYSKQFYIKIGNCLSNRPFIPFVTPIGQAAYAIENKLQTWQDLTQDALLFIAPSQAIADAMIRNRLSEAKIKVIPHGIPLVTPQCRPSEINPKTIAFYYTGRICYVKGIHILLEAFHRIKNDNISLHLIGGATTKSEIRYQKKLQHKYKSDSRIIWHGKVPANKVVKITQQFHVLIHPAIYLEVYGLTIAEAVSQGQWVIATRCGGAEMQITEGRNGNLIIPNDIPSLQRAIENYIISPKISSSTIVKSIQEYTEQIYTLFLKSSTVI